MTLLDICDKQTVRLMTDNIEVLYQIQKENSRPGWEIWGLSKALTVGYILGIRAERKRKKAKKGNI